MKINQISVFLENKPGQILEITRLLFENDINLIAVNIAETADYGILRVITDNPDKSLAILRDNNFITASSPVVAIAVENKVGGLYKLLETFNNENINVEYMYSIVGKYNGLAYMIFKVDDPEKLVQTAIKYDLKPACLEDLSIK